MLRNPFTPSIQHTWLQSSLSWGSGPSCFPHHYGPGQGPAHSRTLTLSSPNNPTVFLTGNSPLGITCDNIAQSSKPLLIKDSFDRGSVSAGDVIAQTRSPAAAAIETVRVYTDCSNTSDFVLNGNLSPFIPVITEMIVLPPITALPMLKQAALSPANKRGAVEGACVYLGGGGGGQPGVLTDGLSDSPSIVSAPLGRDALSPTSTRGALEGPSVVPVPAALPPQGLSIWVGELPCHCYTHR